MESKPKPTAAVPSGAMARGDQVALAYWSVSTTLIQPGVGV
jgi:hypothetical protein